MEMAADSPQKTLIVTCEEVVDIQLANELHAQLKTALDQRLRVEIVANRVERVDAAILQIFYAYFLAARKKELEVAIKGASDNFQRAASLLGLSEGLGLAEVAL
ncbi:MAG: STAS domain-containing protein [Gammaproteobacteria bacterium]|nr:STAS domain-containing protein [Gammaproteobacteria bacterium]